MDFINEYKKLDALLKEDNEVGISGYIKEIEKIKNNDKYNDNIDQDYKKLKHLRWVRNKIAHEPDIKEDELYNEEDIKWLKSFYNKVKKSKDSLSIYKIENKNTTYSFIDILTTVFMITILIFAICRIINN